MAKQDENGVIFFSADVMTVPVHKICILLPVSAAFSIYIKHEHVIIQWDSPGA